MSYSHDELLGILAHNGEVRCETPLISIHVCAERGAPAEGSALPPGDTRFAVELTDHVAGIRYRADAVGADAVIRALGPFGVRG